MPSTTTPTAIVVGSGIAGLVAALTASATHSVTLVTKAALAESNTFYAQGGIAAAMSDDDSVALHVADTLRAGAGLNVRQAVDVLCAEGPERILDLIRFGVAFDRQGDALARGLEAAHSRARVLHAGGDATGAAIETALVDAVRASAARILEHTFVTDLIVRDDRVIGIETLDAQDGRARLEADAVILASGGAGQLYRHTTNPAVTTGDGVAAAWRAGAELADVEFYQFHPTALALPGNFLVSEAVRGEGALLRNAVGERFMLELHPDAELAPRDVVARGIAIEMTAQGGTPVVLDATGLGSAFLARRFPTIDAACRRAGLDWARETIPVTPAAHYWMGGIATDVWGRSSLRGLYAVGEAACTGAHGANRLASNSLLESVVFAHRAARSLADGESRDASVSRWSSGATRSTTRIESSPTLLHQQAVERPTLQHLMWDAAGLHRSGDDLDAAAESLAGWRAAEPAGASVTELENRNLLDLARVLVAAALERRESRGAHFRSDYPAPSAEFARHLAWAREVAIAC
ncbi:MAG: L-aspartate oxidase [Lacisediminihabitans sp.]